MDSITYKTDQIISTVQFIDVLKRSTLSDRRPIADISRIESMLKNSNLICTAWLGECLVGVARSLTDFSYCCYLSDLAVDLRYQGRGIGTELIRCTQRSLFPDCKIILLSAPKAEAYYPKIGMHHHHSAWITAASPLLSRCPESRSTDCDTTSCTPRPVA